MSEKIKIPVTRIRKGDRFVNQWWGGKVVIATTDAYRLDGRDDDVSGYRPGRKPKVALLSYGDGQWHHNWWQVEVGITDGNGAGGGWSALECEYIEVEREVA